MADCKISDGHCIVAVPPPAGEEKELMLVVGTGPKDWPFVLAHQSAAERAIGIHPWNAHLCSEADLKELKRLLEADPKLRLGEIGLDKSSKHKHSFATQKHVFQHQLAISNQLHRSASVHCVRAHGTLLDILQNTGSSNGILLHSFSGSRDIALALLRVESAIYFGVSKKINLQHFSRELCDVVPRNRIIIESDLFENDLQRQASLQHVVQILGMTSEEGNSNLVAFLALQS